MTFRTTTIFFLLFLAIPFQVFATANLEVDGKIIAANIPAYEYHGHTYVAIEPALSALGFQTTWNELAGRLLFKQEDNAGVLSPRSDYITYNGIIKRLQVSPRYLDAKLCAPEDFFTSVMSELLGKKIGLPQLVALPAPPSMGLPYKPLVLKRIVIDAGHGGHDSGAQSPQGLKEKDIVLSVAKRLARRLRTDMGIEVVMTRNDDTFVSLSDRARIANTSGSDLFFCIHANGAFNNTATGTETFFLSYEASDRQAARLAAEENKYVSINQNGFFPGGGGDDIKQILWDMVRTETLKESEKLAIAVQEKLAQQLNLPSRGVKQAPFYVLMGSSIPAILVEIGFMTTSEEANQLASPKVQEHIASVLFQALLHYDTVLALKQ